MTSAPARPRLTDWAGDTYSQNGEDGMIAEALRRIGDRHRRCVEFGAHDGFTFSNTARLWHDLHWKAVLIEPDPVRFRTLQARTQGHDCVTLRRPVGLSGPDRLDRILEGAGVPLEVDVLSIDVDGDDVRILRSLGDTALRPRIIVCEYNPTFPWDLELEGEPGAPVGCSLLTLATAAAGTGYALVGATAGNAILVANEDAAAFADLDTDLAHLADRSRYTYIVSDYAGRSAIVGPFVYEFRNGLPRIEGTHPRRDVVLRWTLRGAIGYVRFRIRNARRALRGLPPREAARAIMARLRRPV